MITKEKFDFLEKWFDKYTDSFKTDDTAVWQNIDLKINHTKNVCKETREISQALNLNGDQKIIAETVALLHDIGRFEQFSRYKTFADNKSENHSLLAEKIIEENKLLDDVDINTKKIILDAIKNHNKKNISENDDENTLLFSKIIRDADKLDNFRVILEHRQMEKKEKNSAITLDLPDGIVLTNEIYEKLINGETINYEDLKTSLDFKLIYLSWIYDINFQHSLIKIREKKYLEAIYDGLPHDTRIKELFNKIQNFIIKKLFIKI